MKENNNINYSSGLNSKINLPYISNKEVINKCSSSRIINSFQDQDLYKVFELFLCKNKFHLNNNYDKNNSQIFLNEKNQVLANVVLDDYIEGEADKTVLGDNNTTYIKNKINKVQKNNKNNLDIKDNHGIKENSKIKDHNQSFEGGTLGCPPGSLFDTAKADLLCLILGMGNNCHK